MPFLFIGATGNHAGQTLLTWAIAKRLVQRGLRVGFLKPFGSNPVYEGEIWTDRDALLFKEVLGLQESLERICPFLLSEDACKQKNPEEIINEIKPLARELSLEKDILLIMGSRHIFFDDVTRPVPDISLVKELNADFLMVDRFQEASKSIYSILSISSLLKERVKGIIINRVPPERLEEVKESLIPSLTGRGIPITTALPEDPAISFRSLGDIKELLKGELLCGEERLGQSVAGMTVGSTSLQGGLRVFKRAYNKITLLESALHDPLKGEESKGQPKIAGILLTGGQKPTRLLIQAAQEAGIALIIVQQDTFSVLEQLEKTPPTLSSRDQAKVDRFTVMLDHDQSFDGLLRSLGIPL